MIRPFTLILILMFGVGIISMIEVQKDLSLRVNDPQDYGCIRIQQYQKYGIYVKNICDSKNIIQFSLQDIRNDQLFNYRSDCLAPQQSSYFNPQINNQAICDTADCKILNTSTIACSYSSSSSSSTKQE